MSTWKMKPLFLLCLAAPVLAPVVGLASPTDSISENGDGDGDGGNPGNGDIDNTYSCTDVPTNPKQICDCLQSWSASSERPEGLAKETIEGSTDLDWLDVVLRCTERELRGKPREDLRKFKKEVVNAKIGTEVRARRQVFTERGCGAETTLCLYRDGTLFTREEVLPRLISGDSLTVIVLSDGDHESDRRLTSVTSRNVRSTVTLLEAGPRTTGARGTKDASERFDEIARLELVVPSDTRQVEVLFRRDASGGSAAIEVKHSLDVELGMHLVEYGLGLFFPIVRRVDSRGAHRHDMEPDLTFTVTWFPTGRVSGQPSQIRKCGRKTLENCRFLGVVLGVDVTNPVAEKHYYVGADVSPVKGLAANIGLALVPFEYRPLSGDVEDLISGDIVPIKRYHISFFFGVRVTPELFESAKATFNSLGKNL